MTDWAKVMACRSGAAAPKPRSGRAVRHYTPFLGCGATYFERAASTAHYPNVRNQDLFSVRIQLLARIR